jgi:hypothetical protein
MSDKFNFNGVCTYVKRSDDSDDDNNNDDNNMQNI